MTESTAPVATSRGRSRYIDCLRALALIRVIMYHLLGWAWLPLLFPSMGIMFALAGSLVAASLDRGSPWKVLLSRTRRLLPSLWLMGLVLVPVMIWKGWDYDAVTFAGQPLEYHTLLFWVFPIYTPPGSAWGANLVLPLWYISTYLWLLLISPALLWLFRRWPAWTIGLPLSVLVAFSTGLVVSNGSRTDEVTISICTFSTCWLMGFAHHDNRIRPVAKRLLVPLAGALLISGVLWGYTHQRVDTGWNVGEIPLANALYCLGAVLILLRFQPSFSCVARSQVLDRLVTVFNSRALTIYLWGNAAIAAAIVLEHRYVVGHYYQWGDVVLSRGVQLIITCLLLAGFVVTFGWVEDVAARRPIQFNPWPRASGTRPQLAAKVATAGRADFRIPAQSVAGDGDSGGVSRGTASGRRPVCDAGGLSAVRCRTSPS